MKFSKFILIPVMVAALAATVQIIDSLLQSCSGACPSLFITGKGFGWVTFQAWAVYFFAGCTLQNGVKAFVGYLLGIGGSIAIIALSGILASSGVPGFWSTPLSLLILVIPIICLERAKIMIPALFIGSGAFFAIMTFLGGTDGINYWNVAVTEILYCLVGLTFGWITITLRGKYEKCVAGGCSTKK
jgi:hypothetical protein